VLEVKTSLLPIFTVAIDSYWIRLFENLLMNFINLSSEYMYTRRKREELHFGIIYDSPQSIWHKLIQVIAQKL